MSSAFALLTTPQDAEQGNCYICGQPTPTRRSAVEQKIDAYQFCGEACREEAERICAIFDISVQIPSSYEVGFLVVFRDDDIGKAQELLSIIQRKHPQEIARLLDKLQNTNLFSERQNFGPYYGMGRDADGAEFQIGDERNAIQDANVEEAPHREPMDRAREIPSRAGDDYVSHALSSIRNKIKTYSFFSRRHPSPWSVHPSPTNQQPNPHAQTEHVGASSIQHHTGGTLYSHHTMPPPPPNSHYSPSRNPDQDPHPRSGKELPVIIQGDIIQNGKKNKAQDLINRVGARGVASAKAIHQIGPRQYAGVNGRNEVIGMHNIVE